MKLTKRQLKRIIREEKRRILQEIAGAIKVKIAAFKNFNPRSKFLKCGYFVLTSYRLNGPSNFKN